MLVNASFLANVVRSIGLVRDSRNTRLYGRESQHQVGQHQADADSQHQGLYQDPLQIGAAMAYLARQRVRTYLELGVWSAWTTVLMSAHLSRFVPEGAFRGFAVDITARRISKTTHAMLTQLDVSFVYRDGLIMHSLHKSRGTRHQNHPPRLLDLCFVDGSHSYSGVRKDYDELASHCRFMMFHDVVDFDSFALEGRGIPGFWAHLKANVDRGRVREFIQQEAVFPTAFGIGLLLPNTLGTAESDNQNLTHKWDVGGAVFAHSAKKLQNVFAKAARDQSSSGRGVRG